MDEYISKQSVIDYLNGYLDSIVECGADSLFDTRLFDKGQRKALINSIQDISEIKAADIQPVKHGNWCGYLCSECNEYADYFISGDDFYFNEKPNFCPYCGARMDGDSKC